MLSRVRCVIKIHDVKQGSEEWMKLRAGIVTASELDSILTPTFEVRKGETPHTYLTKKLAEKWRGFPERATVSFGDMEQGTIREGEAIPWYELVHNCTIQRVGFITRDDGRCGCSPDGLLGNGKLPEYLAEHHMMPVIKCASIEGGIEVKCPTAHTHVKYLLKNALPNEYAVQVHSSMYITGAPWWKFLSYCPGFPALVLTIRRDEEIIDKIHAAVTDFNAAFDAAFAKLKSK